MPWSNVKPPITSLWTYRLMSQFYSDMWHQCVGVKGLRSLRPRPVWLWKCSILTPQFYWKIVRAQVREHSSHHFNCIKKDYSYSISSHRTRIQIMQKKWLDDKKLKIPILQLSALTRRLKYGSARQWVRFRQNQKKIIVRRP